MLASFEPEKAPTLKYNDVEWNQWDRFEMAGEMTLTEFIEYFRNEHKLQITGIMHGQTMLYADWTPPAKLKDRMHLTMSQLIELVTRRRIHPTVRSLRFQLTCENLEGEDVDDVPSVHYTLPVRRHRTKKPAKPTTNPNTETQ